jgi:hypothetical protein
MNWTNVVFTPAVVGATEIQFSGVTSVQIDPGGSLAKFSGDGDRYPTLIINDFNEPTITVHTADLSALRQCSVGAVGTIQATLMDARNGTGTGAITYVMTNAVVATNPLKGGHRQFGESTITFHGYSADGTTNPLTSTIVGDTP